MASEIESKYQVPADFSVDDRLAVDGVRLGEPQRQELSAVYYDTADLRLAADKVALRRRTGGHDAGWHVKRYRGAGDRDEVQLPMGRGGAVPAAVSAEVRAVSRGEALRPAVRMTTQRTEWPLLAEDGTVLALVADDDVATEVIADPAAAQRWRELEVELRSELGEHLPRSVFPADESALLGHLVDSNAPDRLQQLVRQLPTGRVYDHLGEVVQALGLHEETGRS